MTHKQKKFVEAYLGEANGNATEAARIAGYAGNDNTLKTVGCEVKHHPKVSAMIAWASQNLKEIADDGLKATVHRLKAAIRRSPRVDIVYIIQCGETDHYKVGYTSTAVEERCRGLQTASPFKLNIVDEFASPKAKEIEREVHAAFGDVRAEGEWFRLTDALLEDVRAFISNRID